MACLCASFCLFLLGVFAVGVVCDRGPQARHCWSSEYHFHQQPATEPCYGENLCHCSNTTANCSLTLGNLTFIPNLERQYQVLNFSYNNVTHISADFFTNASKEVQILDLYNNGLVSIASGAFRPLTKLTTLLLGGSNHIGYQYMHRLLLLPSLTNISFSCLGLTTIPPRIFQHLEKSQVIFLDLAWNSISSLNLSLFQPLKHLKELVLWRNKIYELETAYQPTWEILNLSSNRLYVFPQTCFKVNNVTTPLFPNLKRLSLDHNNIDSIGREVCLQNLTYISLNYNKFQYLITDMFSVRRFPSLKTLNLIQMEKKIHKMEPYFINNSEVRMINFFLNIVDFSSGVVNEDAFAGCSRVELIQLNENNLQKVSDQRLHRLLRSMRGSLKKLFLGNTQITQITPQTFSPFNLTELYLFGNALTFIPDGAFDNLRHLKTLVMDSNYIKTISPNTFSFHLQNSLDRIHLGNNPFQCSCDILWFQKWFRSDPGRFLDREHPQHYMCSNVHNVSLEHFVLNDQACILGSDAAALTISISIMLITFFVLFAIFFRFRWHMRLIIYEVCRGRYRRRARDRYRRFRYDAFVSFAEEDAPWVQRELMPRVEGEWGLRLCLHYRDFVPGKHIMDNISDCVDNSSRVLLIFSPDFAQSEWCQFELKYCHSYVMERDEELVLVMMQGTESLHLTGAMMALLRTTTYLDWTEAPEAQQAFWGRLRLALVETEEEEERD